MPVTPEIQKQIDSLSPEQAQQLLQEFKKQSAGDSGNFKRVLGRSVNRGFSAFGEGALLGFQGRPISEHSAFKEKSGYEELLRTERLKNQIDPSRRASQMELDEIERKRKEQAGSAGSANVQLSPATPSGLTMPTSISETPPMFIEKPKGKNKYGIMEYETIDNPEYKAWEKAQEGILEDKAGAQKSMDSTKDFIRSFAESRQELVNAGFENIGSANMEGFGQRMGAQLQEKTGTLPKTTKFANRLNVIANATARDIEGGRITDQDRTVYASAMANAIKFPDETNVGLTAASILDLKRKGGDIEPVLKEFENSGVDLFQSIASEVRRLESPLSEGQQSVPQLGGTFQGQKVINVERIE